VQETVDVKWEKKKKKKKKRIAARHDLVGAVGVRHDINNKLSNQASHHARRQQDDGQTDTVLPVRPAQNAMGYDHGLLGTSMPRLRKLRRCRSHRSRARVGQAVEKGARLPGRQAVRVQDLSHHRWRRWPYRTQRRHKSRCATHTEYRWPEPLAPPQHRRLLAAAPP